MKLKYFGTSAYEGIPAVGCSCDVCKHAREVGGRNVRFRTQALIDDTFLIDYPPEVVLYNYKFNLDYTKLKGCIISHSHSDHLSISQIELLKKGYAGDDRKEPFHFFVGEDGYNKIKAIMEDERMKGRADVTLIKPFEEFEFCGYRILPLPATHAESSSPLIFLIEKEGKKLLWAHDTGVFKDEVYEAIFSEGKLDCISLDCCAGLLKNWRSHHLGLDTCREVFDLLEAECVLDYGSIKIINHFSHNDKASYDDLVANCEEDGIVVSYDGMEIEF